MGKEQLVWTADHAALERHLVALRDAVLVNSLALVSDTRNSETKLSVSEDASDVADWVLDPFRGDGPFGFNTCCLAAGVDPEKLAEKVLHIFRGEQKTIGTPEKVRRYLASKEERWKRRSTVDTSKVVAQTQERLAATGTNDLFN